MGPHARTRWDVWRRRSASDGKAALVTYPASGKTRGSERSACDCKAALVHPAHAPGRDRAGKGSVSDGKAGLVSPIVEF